MQEVWIIDSVRTPRGVGRVGKGALTDIHPQRLLATTLRALQERNDINTAEVDDVIAGCSTQSGKQGSCIARMAQLDAGWDQNSTGMSLQRFCGSGMSAVSMAAAGIAAGYQDVVVAGGVEMMSYTPSVPNVQGPLLDCNNLHLREMHPMPLVGVAADLIATLEGFSREDVDTLAYESQMRAKHAIENGHFDKSLVTVYKDDGTVALDHEEFPRPNTTMEGLAALKPAFVAMYDNPIEEGGPTHRQLLAAKYGGMDLNHVHHGGNSSGVVDGAAALLLCSPEYAKAQGWKPRAKFRMMANAGDETSLVLNAPASAARKALKRAGMDIKDVDLIEVNEAFACVPLKFMKEMGVDRSIVNVNGGAMALGHPIGATGAIILGTLLDELERRDLNVGLATMCAAGAMAPAAIIERM